MKILFYIPSLNYAGGQAVVTSLACELSRTNDVIVLVKTDEVHNKYQIELDKAKVKLFYAGKSNCGKKNSIRTFFRIIKLIRMCNPDVISVHLDYYYTWLYSLIFRKKIFLTVHSQSYRFLELSNRFLFNALNKFNLIEYILLSPQNAKEFEDITNVNRERIHIIPNPIEIPESMHDEPENDDSIVRFINIARFHPIKNHKMLVDAFYKVQKSAPNTILELVGKGDLFEEIKEYVKKLGIEDKVVFLGEVDNVNDILRRADIAVLSSFSECFPIFLLESMAAGLPIISTNVGGVGDIINDNGFVVNVGDVDDMANKMFLLLRDGCLRRQMGKKSMQEVSKYEVKQVTQKYQDVFMK